MTVAIAVDLGGRSRVACRVARTHAEQAQGLQGSKPLRYGQGMIFPFRPPKSAHFHMGTVAFPIDLIFAAPSGEVGRIVHGALPGSCARWSFPMCAAVVELSGGTADRVGLRLGDRIATPYNLLQGITEAEKHEADGPPLDGGYYSKPPFQHRLDPSRVPPEDRQLQHTLNDDPRRWDAMDQPNSHWDQNPGYNVTHDDLEYAVRPGVVAGASGIGDASALVAGVIEALARGGPEIRWHKDTLTAGQTESAVIDDDAIAAWIDHLPLSDDDAGAVVRAATSPEGLELLGDGLIIAGLADITKVKDGRLVLWRGKRP